MRVLISAGEASGDAYGASLVRALRRAGTDLDLAAVGGPKLRAEIGELVADSSTWGTISIIQSLRVVPRVLRSFQRIRRRLAGDPGLFIPIDFGYLNIRLARHAKAAGWRVMYFIPPGSWRRDRQGADIPKISDQIVCPFPWSAEILTRMGGNARFFGHPIRQLMRESDVNDVLRQPILAVLPGSRRHELEMNIPMIAAAMRDDPRPIRFGLAAGIDPAAFRQEWELRSGRRNDEFATDGAARTLAGAEAAIVCSGTATLEAALTDTPMAVIYAMSRAMNIEARLVGMKRPKYVALPNILLNRFAVPELVQYDATVENLRQTMAHLDTAAQHAAFREIDHLLGPDDAIDQAARWALNP